MVVFNRSRKTKHQAGEETWDNKVIPRVRAVGTNWRLSNLKN